MGALEKEYLKCYWTSDTNILTVYVQGGDILARISIFQVLNLGWVINY